MMLSLQNAGKRFGPRILFQEANWLIRARKEQLLVGANGTGKSTLMKVLAGLESLDYGDAAATVRNEHRLSAAGGPGSDGPHRLRGVPDAFRRAPRYGGEIERLGGAACRSWTMHAGVRGGGRALFSCCRSAFMRWMAMRWTRRWDGADRAGLQQGRLVDARREEFSGGWQMRIALAKLLLQKPNLLLLDEPTNHLDLETRNWLEDYLHDYPNALHPHLARPLLPRRHRRPRSSRSGTSAFTSITATTTNTWRRRKSGATQLEAAYKNQREHIEQLEAFINRFRYQATKAKQVQSRIKELEKIERIEVPEEEPTIHFTFPQPPPSGPHRGRRSQGWRRTTATKQVFNDVQLHHRARRPHRPGRRERRGQIHTHQAAHRQRNADRGQLKLGHNVEPDYFAQDQYKVLDPDARMLDDISRRATEGAGGRAALRCSAASCSRATTCSSRWACSPAASAIAMRWRGF